MYGSGSFPARPKLSEALRRGAFGRDKIPGSTIGGYVVSRELGRGGMGVVLEAQHMQTGQRVALKVMIAGAKADAKARKRFLREGQLGGDLSESSAGVVAVYATGEEDGLLWAAMEYVDGGTLKGAMEHASPAEIVDLFVPLCRTLARAHGEGVIHRDLKPDNVLIRSSDGEPLLADFGLARDLNLSSSLTKTGNALGTPRYMPPEQIRGEHAGPAADVYSLGVMLYEGLTGEQHVVGPNIAIRLASIMSDAVERPSKHNPDVPRALDGIVLKCLRPKPEARYPDAGALLEALEGFQQGGGAGSRVPLFAGVAALLVVVGVGGVALTMGGEPATADGPPGEPPPPTDPAPTTGEGNPVLARVARVLEEADPQARLRQARGLAAEVSGSPLPAAIAQRLEPWRQIETPKGAAKPKLQVERYVAAYDSDAEALLVFGAAHPVSTSRSELWKLDLNGWSNVGLGTMPPDARRAFVAAYDSEDKRVLIHGGRRGETVVEDLWEWRSEGGWKMIARRGPPGRSRHAMVYDPQRKGAVIFGGRGAQGLLDDLWIWRNEEWSKLPNVDGPSSRAGHSMVHDGERLYLFGGYGAGNRLLDDLWSYDAERGWTELTPDSGPSPRQAAGLAAIGPGHLFLYGGGRLDLGLSYGDTWVYADGAWAEREPVQTPPHRLRHVLGYLPKQRAVVMYGGQRRSRTGQGELHDAWSIRLDVDPAAESAAAPPAPEGQGRLAALSRLGMVLQEPRGQQRLEAARAVLEEHPDDAAVEAVVRDLRPWRRVELGDPAPPHTGHRLSSVYAPEFQGVVFYGGFMRDTKTLAPEVRLLTGTALRMLDEGKSGPGGTWELGAAWDPGRRILWAFQIQDLWSWESSRGWKKHPRQEPWPAKRQYHGLCWDPERQVAVMVTGAYGPADESHDVWEWDGKAWTRHDVKDDLGPGVRATYGLTYDASRKQVVIYGGTSAGKHFGDVWGWDGKRWNDLTPKTGPTPPPRQAMGFAYGAGRLILHGGHGDGPTVLADTWALEGDRWVRLHPVVSPPPMRWHSLTYDEVRKVFVAYGGTGSGHDKPVSELWEY